MSCKQISWFFCRVSLFLEAALLPVGTAAQERVFVAAFCCRWPMSPPPPIWVLLARVTILTLSPAPDVTAWPRLMVQRQSTGLIRALRHLCSRRALSQSSPQPLRLFLLRIELPDPGKELTSGTVDRLPSQDLPRRELASSWAGVPLDGCCTQLSSSYPRG